METSPSPAPADKSMPEIDKTLSPEEAAFTAPEVEIELPHTQAPELTFQEGDFVKHAIEKQPEAVFQHVLKAAEEGEPIEGRIERKHEIKDEETTGPVPIGSVIAGTAYPVAPTPVAVSPSLSEEITPATSPSSPTATHLTYKQAIVRGFGFGVAIVAFIILYLLFK